MQDLDDRFRQAVGAFWALRATQQEKQAASGRIDAGTRGAVTGGTQMGALEDLVVEILIEAGLERSEVRTRSALEIPGYYRPEKSWDLLVVADNQLVLAVEFKSQVGPSFGNNFNNRTEEAIGNAEDVWIAYREGRFGTQPAPLLGYLFLLEDCAAVHTTVRNRESNFEVDPLFRGGASYAGRYQVLCERLLLERKYSSVCLALTKRPTQSDGTRLQFPTSALSFERFTAAIEAHARLFVASRGQSVLSKNVHAGADALSLRDM